MSFALSASPGADEEVAVPARGDLPTGKRQKWLHRLRALYQVSTHPSRSLPMEGLRGFAVILVFFVHYHAIFADYINPGTGLFKVSHFLGLAGNTGVDLFFVLSGYLIYGALLRRRPQYLKFIRRRAERIFPAFLCVLVLYLGVSAVRPNLSKVHGPFLPGAAQIAANVLLLPGIFHITPVVTVAWSLSYEFFFYLTMPLLVLLTHMAAWQRKWRILFFLAVWACYLAYSFTVATSNVRLLMFVSGIVLYEVISSGSWKGFLKTRTGEVFSTVLFVGSLVFAYALDTDKLASVLPGAGLGNTVLPGVISWEGPYKVMALSLSCFLLTLFCMAGQGFLARTFSWTPIRYLGNMSYSFYLLHGATLMGAAYVFHQLFKPDGGSPVVFCLLLPVVFLASWGTSTALFAFVEKPISLQTWSLPDRVDRKHRANSETMPLVSCTKPAAAEEKGLGPNGGEAASLS